MTNLKGKIALVTGSSRGLGRSMAISLARHGADVVVSYLKDEENAGKTVKEIKKNAIKSRAIQADLRKWGDAQNLINETIKHFKKIDILVNNAGDFIEKPLSQLKPDEWDNQISSNLNSAFYCSKAALPFMRQKGYGRIINIAMANANRIHAYKQVGAHAIAKSGVLILTKCVALEEAAHGITVNAISPGLMNNGSQDELSMSEMALNVPMKKLGSPQDMMGALLYLLSDDAAYVTGTEIIVSGGWGL